MSQKAVSVELVRSMAMAGKINLWNAINSTAQLHEVDYTPASWANLQTALAAARAVYLDRVASQQNVNNAANLLRTAIRALVPANQPQPAPTPAPTNRAGIVWAIAADVACLLVFALVGWGFYTLGHHSGTTAIAEATAEMTYETRGPREAGASANVTIGDSEVSADTTADAKPDAIATAMAAIKFAAEKETGVEVDTTSTTSQTIATTKISAGYGETSGPLVAQGIADKMRAEGQAILAQARGVYGIGEAQAKLAGAEARVADANVRLAAADRAAMAWRLAPIDVRVDVSGDVRHKGTVIHKGIVNHDGTVTVDGTVIGEIRVTGEVNGKVTGEINGLTKKYWRDACGNWHEM